MKKNDLYKIIKPVLSSGKIMSGTLSCMFILLVCEEGKAQSKQDSLFVNTGVMHVVGDVLSTDFDFENRAVGPDGTPVFTNDGAFYVYRNWRNDGIVDFTRVSGAKKSNTKKNASTSNGITIFGNPDNDRFVVEQEIVGGKSTAFQNVLFNNKASLVPFILKDSISVNNNSQFLLGIINGEKNGGRIIFNEDAFHSDASDLSFVDGEVKKIGSTEFEFPVGNDLYFRPAYYSSQEHKEGYNYISQYFHKPAANLEGPKEPAIGLINGNEYWKVTREKDGKEGKFVLSITLDSNTTPSEFLNVPEGKELAIVRWDGTKWINEKGAVEDRPAIASDGAGYTKLLMAEVNGFGIFTMALVDAVTPDAAITVYNAISPNDDGLNDSFLIKGISQYPDNEVEIFNRWGVKVFHAKSYNESDNMFRGYSDGRGTIKRGDKLPTGTYFYILRYTNNDKKGMEKSGYLYINNQ